MPVVIRMARAGTKKRPFYHIVAADSRAPRDGRFIEKLGTYNPLLAKDSPERVTLDADRISHWLSVGAQPSDRVLRFLAGLVASRSFDPGPTGPTSGQGRSGHGAHADRDRRDAASVPVANAAACGGDARDRAAAPRARGGHSAGGVVSSSLITNSDLAFGASNPARQSSSATR